jgi:uncharacterized membrane protein
MYNWTENQKLTLTGLFIALIFAMTAMGIGILNLGFIRPTVLHIPVIIGALLLGPKYGAILGLAFGFSSMLFATAAPGPTSFVFSPFINLPGTENGSLASLIVAFVPRILVGIVPWFVFKGIMRVRDNQWGALVLAGIAGSLTNTLLVLNFIYFLFGNTWNAARGDAAAPTGAIYTAIMGMVLGNGIPEAVVAGILVTAICTALFAVARSMRVPVKGS